MLMMIKNGLSVGGFSSAAMAMGSRRFFNAGRGGGGIRRITTESSSLIKRDMFRVGDIHTLFRGRQTGGCVGSFVPHQCNKCHMLPYFARGLASNSDSQSLGQTPRQEPERKKKECQIKRSSELQRERCDEISSTKFSLNQFPGLMVHGNVVDSKTRRLLRLNPDNGCFEEEQGVSAADASNHHGHYELQVPNGHVCRGSAYGWLFLTDDNLDMKLLNPFSGAEIQLPPVKTLPNIRKYEEGRSYLYKWYVTKAVFSANPSIEPRPVVLVILGYGNRPRLAFCKPGDKGWTPLEFPEHTPPMDAIYHNDQFYVLGYRGSITGFDIGRCIDDDDHSVKTVIVAPLPPENNLDDFRDWFFVVLDGEFFRFELRKMCFRDCCVHESMQQFEYERERDGDSSDEDYSESNGDGDTSDEDHSDSGTTDEDHSDSDTTDEDHSDSGTTDEDHSDSDTTDEDHSDSDTSDVERWNRREFDSCYFMDIPPQTYGIKIRRFDASEKQWVKVESLGDKAVFLGYNTSFALSASDYPAGVCIPDSVYFSYGNVKDGRNDDKRCYDVGIYNVKDKSVKSLYPLRSQKKKSLYPPMDDEDEGSQFKKPAPIWIVNNNA